MKYSILISILIFFFSCKKHYYEIENYQYLSGKYKIVKLVDPNGNYLKSSFPYDTINIAFETSTKKGRKLNYGELKVNKNINFLFSITNVFNFNGASQNPSPQFTPYEKIFENLDYKLITGNWEIIQINTKNIQLKKISKDNTMDTMIIFERL